MFSKDKNEMAESAFTLYNWGDGGGTTCTGTLYIVSNLAVDHL